MVKSYEEALKIFADNEETISKESKDKLSFAHQLIRLKEAYLDSGRKETQTCFMRFIEFWQKENNKGEELEW
jgi:hypothetical protein